MKQDEGPKVKEPMIMDKESDAGQPMTSISRPGWVTDRPPVGQSVGDIRQQESNPDPTKINQKTDSSVPSMGIAGTPGHTLDTNAVGEMSGDPKEAEKAIKAEEKQMKDAEKAAVAAVKEAEKAAAENQNQPASKS